MRIGKKNKILSLLVVISLLCSYVRANMAPPSMETQANSAIASKDLHILNETIYLKIDNACSGKYRVVYNIRSDEAGMQIPFLFHALDFGIIWPVIPKVTLDGKPIKLYYVDSTLSQGQLASLLEKFSNYAPANGGQKQTLDTFITIFWDNDKKENSGYNSNSTIYALRELIFFRLDITPGVHQIVVEYQASSCELNDGFGTELFRYALQPARYWKSFGGLVFKLDASELSTSRNIAVSLGNPHKGSLDSVAYWEYKSLPADYFHVVVKLNAWEKYIYTGVVGWVSWAIIFMFIVFIQYRRVRNIHADKYVQLKPLKVFIKIFIYFLVALAISAVLFIIQTYSAFNIYGLILIFMGSFLLNFVLLILLDTFFNRYFRNKYAKK
ncbi:MAG: hypothetical protein RLZZ161_1918 [Bacteroidota bacterium]|jgi:hypothetical protein